MSSKYYPDFIFLDKVFAIISVYGSTPCTAILDDIKQEKVPVFPTAASTQNMYDPPNRYLFWYACNDEDNGIMMLDYIVNDLKAKGVTHCFYAGYAPVYAALLQEANKIGWKPVFFGDYVTIDPRTFMAGDLAGGHYHFFNFGMRHERVPGWIQMEKLFTAKLGEKAAKEPLGWRLMPLMWTPLIYLTQALQDIGPDLTREKLVDTLESIQNFDTGGWQPFSLKHG